jgi:hypothetical protein
VILNPLFVDRNVAFKKLEARIVHELRDAITVHVHAKNLPIGGFQNPLGKMMTNETIDAKDEDFFHAIKSF